MLLRAEGSAARREGGLGRVDVRWYLMDLVVVDRAGEKRKPASFT